MKPNRWNKKLKVELPNYLFSCTGQIGYALAPMIARGAMLGPDQPVILHLHDIQPVAESLKGVEMELIDSAFPLLQGIALNFEGSLM